MPQVHGSIVLAVEPSTFAQAAYLEHVPIAAEQNKPFSAEHVRDPQTQVSSFATKPVVCAQAVPT